MILNITCPQCGVKFRIVPKEDMAEVKRLEAENARLNLEISRLRQIALINPFSGIFGGTYDPLHKNP